MSGTTDPNATVNLYHPVTKGEFSCPLESFETVWKERGWTIRKDAKPE